MVLTLHTFAKDDECQNLFDLPNLINLSLRLRKDHKDLKILKGLKLQSLRLFGKKNRISQKTPSFDFPLLKGNTIKRVVIENLNLSVGEPQSIYFPLLEELVLDGASIDQICIFNVSSLKKIVIMNPTSDWPEMKSELRTLFENAEIIFVRSH